LSCYQTDEQAWAASEMIRVEEVVRKSDGNSLFFDTVKVPIFHSDGKRKGMVVIGRDITGRKQIEEALIEAESKYRNLVERALVGVYIYQENTYEYVNPRYAEIFGYTVDELLKLSPLDLLQNGEKKQWIENFHQRISGDNNSLHYQIQGLKKDGTLIECEVHGTVTMYKGKPTIVGTLLVLQSGKKQKKFFARRINFLLLAN
jgi:two-component system, sporulation sensor kinase A